MDTLGLGKIIDRPQQKDAIHVAVEPVIAGERLAPGQHIGFVGEHACAVKNPIGIVDPFLAGPVFEGDRFWMFLYPGSITALRHDWAHAAFTSKGESERWLREFADRQADIPYQELLVAAEEWLEDRSYLCSGGKWESFVVPDEFWDHYERVKEVTVSSSDRGNFFTCSC